MAEHPRINAKGSRDASPDLQRTRQEEPRRPAQARRPGADRRGGENHQDDHLRHRSAHPERRRSNLRARHGAGPRRCRRHRFGGCWRHHLQARRPGADLLHQRLRPFATTCRKGMFSHCTTGGWILGNQIDGTQAEFVRIPYADTSLYPDPRWRRRRSAGDAQRHPAHRIPSAASSTARCRSAAVSPSWVPVPSDWQPC